MRRARNRLSAAAAGFTLLEALVSVAVMGIIMGVLVTVTSQWLPNWSRGLLRVQRNEQLAIALDRLVLDLGAAEYVSAREPGKFLFEGDESSVNFIRSTIGPNDRIGLDHVRFSVAADSQGRALVRARAPFVPIAGAGNMVAKRVSFADPVVLLREPNRIVFSYAGLDGVWKDNWQGSLPSAIRLNVLDTLTQRLLPVSTAVRPHVTLSAPSPEQSEVPEQKEVSSQSQVGEASAKQ